MKIAVVDKKDIVLKIENNSLKFDGQSIPLRVIDMLVLNHRATLQTKDILTLTKEHISVLVVSYQNNNFSLINSANAKNAQLKFKQYLSLQHSLTFAKYFVKNKILSHNEHLKSLHLQESISSILVQVENATTREELMGIEGAFARFYFQHFFSQFPKTMHKNKRSKNPPQDPVNALLSYWYSLYYHIITVKLFSYGFEPSMGYLHTPFREHYALSSDILELFRSEINQAVLRVFKEKMLTMEDFTRKNGVYLKYEGRTRIWSVFMELVAVLEPKLLAEIANLKKEIEHEKV